MNTYHHGNLKQALIEAGIRIINESGEDALSMRKVASACHVSHAAPYAHFKGLPTKTDFRRSKEMSRMPRRLLAALCALLLCAAPLAGAETAEFPLRYDGLYCHIKPYKDGLMLNSVFWFSPEGVISVTVGQRTPESIYFPKESWFGFDKPPYADYVQPWNREGNHLTLTALSKNGTVDYWGEILEDGLVMSGHSNINGRDFEDRAYVFYPFDEIACWYSK